MKLKPNDVIVYLPTTHDRGPEAGHIGVIVEKALTSDKLFYIKEQNNNEYCTDLAFINEIQKIGEL